MTRFSLLLTLGCGLACAPAGAQTADGPACTETGLLDFSEVAPGLIGGLQALQAQLHFPDRERQAGTAGTVVVRFVVETTGFVCGAEVARSVSPGLDRAAVEAVTRARFTPGWQHNRRVPVRMTMPVRFVLH